MAHEVAAQAFGTARIYWSGPHATQIVGGRPFNSPLGKLHHEGLALLRAHGWEQVPPSDARIPCFAFTTRKGADFPAVGPGLPRVRQFPQRCTAVLDDKALLARCLEAAGCAAIAPRTWTDLDAFLEQHCGAGAAASSEAGSGGSNRSSSGGSTAASRGQAGLVATSEAAVTPTAGGSQLYFLKHRLGVKGQAVYPYTSLNGLIDKLQCLGSSGGSQQGGRPSGPEDDSLGSPSNSDHPAGCSSSAVVDNSQHTGRNSSQRRRQKPRSPGGSRQHFVVQEGAAPPLLLPDGRKFTLRAHVLILLEHPACKAANDVGQAQQQEQQEQPRGREQPQPDTQAAVQQGGMKQQQQHGLRLRAWVHEDVIVTPHAEPVTCGCAAGTAGTAGTADVAVHVSSRGRGHPKPFLLRQLALEPHHQQQEPPQRGQAEGQAVRPAEPGQQQPQTSAAMQLQQELWQQICSVSRTAVSAGAQNGLVPSRADPQAVLYHLWAFDFAVAAGQPLAATANSFAAGRLEAAMSGSPFVPPCTTAGSTAGAAGAGGGDADQAQPPQPMPLQSHVLLLEANSYPAIASGTMAAVPRSVYNRLIGDLLSLLVLPALGGGGGEQAGEGAAGGYVRVL